VVSRPVHFSHVPLFGHDHILRATERMHRILGEWTTAWLSIVRQVSMLFEVVPASSGAARLSFLRLLGNHRLISRFRCSLDLLLGSEVRSPASVLTLLHGCGLRRRQPGADEFWAARYARSPFPPTSN
jgi:hypothetical protein